MHQLLRRFEKLVADNSPAILTAVGVTGTIATAILVGKATFRATELIIDEQAIQDLQELGHPLDSREKFELVWKLYIPPVATGTITIVSIVMANQVGTRRAAAVAAAYSLSEKAFTEYREKVLEKLGENKERAVRDELAQNRISKNPPVDREVVITGNGDVLCYEAYSGRYFQSNVEAIRKAENDINHTLLNDGYASLSDFYDKIGLPRTTASEEVGWKNDSLIELRFSTSLSGDGRPCISIDYRVEPIRNYYRFN